MVSRFAWRLTKSLSWTKTGSLLKRDNPQKLKRVRDGLEAVAPGDFLLQSGRSFFVWEMWNLDFCRWRSSAVAMAGRLNVTDQGGNANACQQSDRQLAPVVSVKLQLRQ